MLTDEFLRRYIGRHLNDLFLDLGFPPEAHEEMLASTGRSIAIGNTLRLLCFRAFRRCSARLGGRKSTATTKGTPTTRLVLEQFGLIRHFDHVQGTDGFPAKPEPDVLLKSIAVFGARPEDCLLIGDAPADMEAGRRAGVKTCAVRYGYGDPAEMAKWAPDYWIDRPEELVMRRVSGRAPLPDGRGSV